MLLSCIEPMVEEVKIIVGNKSKKQEAEILIEKATKFVTHCKMTMEKCKRKGVFKREYASVSQQKKWQNRFSELYKTLSELHLQITFQEEVSTQDLEIISSFYHKCHKVLFHSRDPRASTCQERLHQEQVRSKLIPTLLKVSLEFFNVVAVSCG